jgi:hypothetical protein
MAFENGFASESKTIVTEDGYIVGLWRIPGLLNEPDAGSGGQMKKPVALFVHGIDADMNYFTANDGDVAPPYVLVH